MSGKRRQTPRAADNRPRLLPPGEISPPPRWGRRIAHGKARGFTLLELLVALAIFALLATAIYNSLAMLLTTSTRLDESGKSLKSLQATMRIMGRDLIQVVNRPVRSGYDEELPALRWPGVDNQLEMTSGGRSNPLRQSRCSLQRLAYRVKNGRLERLVWPILDQAQDSTPRVQPLLEGVSHLEVSFQIGKDQLSNEWPPANPRPGSPALPQAVRVVLEAKGWGRLERIFPLAGGV